VSTPEDQTADNTYQYDTSVDPPELAAREQPVTSSGDVPSTRSLKDWIDDIHGRGGDAIRGRQLANIPISHYNSWVRVPTHKTADSPSCTSDRGGAFTQEARMDTGNERERPDVGQPTSDTLISVFDGGVSTHPRHRQPL